MISFLEFLFLSAFLSSVLIGIGIFLINPNRTINRIFVLVLVAIATWFFSIFMVIREARLYIPATGESHIFWLRLGSATGATVPWLAQLMIASLTAPARSLWNVLRQSWPWLVLAGVLAALAFSESCIPSNSVPLIPRRGYGYTIYCGALLIQGAVLLASAYRQMQRLPGARRIEMQIFVLNTGLACVMVLLSTYFGRLLDLPLFSRSGPFVFFTLYGLTVWTLSSHRIFDARQVIASLAQRAVILGIMGLSAISLALLLDQVVAEPYHVLVAALGAGLLALACEKPTRRWFGLDDDHRLLAPRRAIFTWARQVSDAGKLKSLFEEFLSDWCQADYVSLLSSNGRAFTGGDICLPPGWAGLQSLCEEGWITPELLQRRKLRPGMAECRELMSRHQLGALLAVPPGSDSPTLVLALGLKRGLRPYTYPDIRLLLNLAELMDNILTHATLSAQAARLAQMESAAMMSRSLAHDLNNLTTPVATYLLHTHGRAAPGSAEAEVYDAAVHSVKVMHDYIRESLFFARRLVPEFKKVDLAQTLASVVRLCQERATRRATTLESFCDGEAALTADPVLFQRLVVNLVNNAIDASPPSGTVTLAIGVKDSGQIAFDVTDQGPGIPPENLPRIFDPYFTTKDTGDSLRGLGLGLAICRKIADLHGGTIEVNSAPGRGTTFTALFPKDGLPERHAREPRNPVAVKPSLLGRMGTQPRPA